MHRLMINAIFLCLLGLSSVAVGGMVVPLEARIRRAVMKSSQIVVGRIVETEPFLLSDRSRVSLLVVDRSLFGSVVESDTLRINWNADSAVYGNGMVQSIACGGGGIQLSELQGASALWLLVDNLGLRSTAGPFLLAVPNRDQFDRLSYIVESGPAKVDSSSFYSVKLAELEALSVSKEKRTAFVRCLRRAIKESE
jgi:hypothetical protein